MSTRTDYLAGVPCWVDTSQPDPVDAARFYSGLFGWQTEDTMPPGAGAHYYMARIDGRDAAVALWGPWLREWGASRILCECQQARPGWPAGPAGVVAC